MFEYKFYGDLAAPQVRLSRCPKTLHVQTVHLCRIFGKQVRDRYRRDKNTIVSRYCLKIKFVTCNSTENLLSRFLIAIKQDRDSLSEGLQVASSKPDDQEFSTIFDLNPGSK